MNELGKKVIAGAVSGFVSALLVDINAWKSSGENAFDWRLAVKRWVLGSVSGALGALGIQGL